MAFPAYLRGIETNTLHQGIPFLVKTGSQPTYEGLKLQCTQTYWESSSSSQPTYEGLKRVDTGDILDVNIGSVPSLPTRD